MKKRNKPNLIVRRARHQIVLPGYCHWYWNHRIGETEDDYQKAAALSARYSRFVNYCREIYPQWKTIRKDYYMDNSIEEEQICRCGQHRRRIMTRPPSGDICF